MLFFTFRAVQAQIPVDMRMDSVLALEAGINALDVRLANGSGEAFEGALRLDLPAGLRGVNGADFPLRILSGKKRFLSLKLAGSDLAKLKNAHLAVRLLDATGREIAVRQVLIRVPEKRSVVLSDHSELQYLRRAGDSIRIKLRLSNNGTTDERLRLLFSSPDRSGSRNFREIEFTLPSGGDSLLHATFPVEKYMLTLPQYTVRVSGVYENADVFGHASIPFSNIASERNFQRMFRFEHPAAVHSNNYLDLEVNNATDAQRMFYLRSQGEYGLRSGKIRYHAFVGGPGDLRHLPAIGNTYLEYENRNVRVGLGNVQESLDASFYGRGIKFSVRDSVSSCVVSAGMVEKTGDLFGLSRAKSPGFSAFARLLVAGEGTGRKGYEGQLYYDQNRLDSTESLLWTNAFDILPPGSPKIRLKGLVGAGVNSFRGDRSSVPETRPSIASGLKWSGRIGQWNYSGDGFFSSAYYTGNRRGVRQFAQRMDRSIGRFNYSMGYAFSGYAPEYFRNGMASSGNSYSKADLSLYLPFSPFVSVGLNPIFHLEKGNYWSRDGSADLSARSWLLAGTANVRSKDYGQNLYAALETGLVSAGSSVDRSVVFRGNLSYEYKGFGLNASFQKGAFHTFEVLNSRLLGEPYGNSLSFGISYGGRLLGGKLSWQANSVANIASGYGQSYVTNVSTSYRIRKNTLLTGTFRHNYRQGMRGAARPSGNVRIGVRQSLKGQAPDRQAAKTGNLNVFCFYDNNSNGRFDEGDEIASDYGFMVRDILFLTDRKGRASFKKMPYGSYMLFFPMHAGYQAMSRAVAIDGRNTEVRVPLQQVGTVRGTIAIDYDPNLSLRAVLNPEGYTLIATDETGRTFDFRSTTDGSFEMSLPQGRYSFRLDATAFPENVYSDENLRTAEVAVGKTVELVPFVLKVKRKKVVVKRF